MLRSNVDKIFVVRIYSIWLNRILEAKGVKLHINFSVGIRSTVMLLSTEMLRHLMELYMMPF